jgi:hypothetical protein
LVTPFATSSPPICVIAVGLLLATFAPLADPADQPRGAAQEPAPTWAFNPPRDEFLSTALLDLRSLNEKQAGETGFVRVGADGGFVRGDGTPIRFWAVNTEVGRAPFVRKPLGPSTAPNLARHARFLAKRGVNMVRLHRQLSPDLTANPNAAITDINLAERDGIWRSVAAMRAEGIYTTISPYWAGPMKFALGWGIAGGAAQPAWGLLFFDPTLQHAYKAWLRQLLLPKNPYTGIPLAQDPSVALLQIQNEDSLLFWTVDAIKGAQRQALETRFAQFLSREHGSLATAVARWESERIDNQALAAGRAPLLPIWELTQAPGTRRATRLADQTEFLARTMFDFNRDIVRFLRDELGVKALVNAGNWKTASALRLNDAERWSYSAADVDAANVYTAGLHKGRYEGWAIVEGDTFTNASVLRNPGLLPLALKQSAGRPMLVTEGNWVMPNAYASEGPFLVATYSSLLGTGGYYWFTTGEEGFATPGSANGYLPSQGKWLFGTPELLGSFPAAALAYRRGYIDRGAPVLKERRALPALWARASPVISEGTSFDPNRDAGSGAPTDPRQAAEGIEATTFLTGPVLQTFDSGLADPTVPPVIRNLQTPIRSNTGQIVLDAARGFCTVDAPRVQGVAAHFGSAPSHTLSDVSFESSNAYGAALAVSMDGLPLATSRSVLLQYATQSRPTGWREEQVSVSLSAGQAAPGFRIVEHGHAPWQVTSARMRVTINNPYLRRATVLDMNGMASGDVQVQRAKPGLTLAFPAHEIYLLLR